MAFTRRCTITPQTGKVPGGAYSNYPTLIKVTHNDLKLIANGGYVTDPDEIRPYPDSAAAGTMIPFERVFYDGTAGTVIMWANIPSLNVAVPYYLFFGDAALTSYAGSTAAWPSEFKNVIHGGDGSTPSAADSSQSALSGTLQNSPGATAGKIHGAITCDGTNDHITLPNIGISGDGDRTISFWCYPENAAGSRYIFSAGTDTGNGQIFAIRVDADADPYRLYNYRNDNDAISANNVIAQDAWNLVHVTYDGSTNNTDISVNGIDLSLTGAGGNFGNDLNLVNSNWLWFTAIFGTFFKGRAEEMRIANVFRSVNYRTTDYNIQSDPSAFASYSFDAAPSGGGGFNGHYLYYSGANRC